MMVGQDIAEAERLLHEVHSRAVAAGNRERTMSALNNLGAVADARQDYAAAREYLHKALALAREIGAQQDIALTLINVATCDIRLGEFSSAHTGLQEGLALAQRLGALPLMVGALIYFAKLARAEGQTEQALALYGLARNQPAWSSEFQHGLDATLAKWALDPSVVEAGLKKGEALGWDATIQELLKG
jgi:tetratricopeptide (TPR) repeat protein